MGGRGRRPARRTPERGSRTRPCLLRPRGEEPTLTDANLVAGRLDPEYFLGGTMPLDVDASQRSLSRLGERTGVDAATAARASFAPSSRRCRTRSGSSRCAAVTIPVTSRSSFGGAGPLHAALLARELGVARTVIPPAPGHFSALGMLLGDLRADAVRTHVGPLDAATIRPVFDELEADAMAELEREAGERSTERFARLRYVGQEHTLEVPLGEGPIDDEDHTAERFDAASEETYAFRLRTAVEIVEARVSVSAARDEPVEWSNAPTPAPELRAARGRPRPARRRANSDGRRTQNPAPRRSPRRSLHRRGAGHHRPRPARTVHLRRRALEPRARGGRVSDRFTTDVLREAFFAVTDEMFESLKRTSQSPVIYEVLDFAVGLTDARGELVSQGNGIAGFSACSARPCATRSFGFRISSGRHRGDERPFAGRRRPSVRCRDGPADLRGRRSRRVRGGEGPLDGGRWQGSRLVDRRLGGDLPGGTAAAVRPRRPRRRVDRDLVAVIGANSRLPDMTIGDLTAFAACLEVAERRVLELCRRYGVDDVAAAMAAAHERSEALSRAAVARLPHGVFEAEDFIDEDGLGNGPFPIRVRVEIDGERVVADFTGTHSQVPGPVNCTRSGLVSGIRTVFKAITDPNEPGSDAWFRPFEVICPPGTIFTAQRPAPVALYFEATEAATDLVWKALAPAMPGAPHGGQLSVCATAIACTHPDTGEPTLLVEPQAGGWGASVLKDGEHGLVSVGDGETYVIPAEVCEQRYGSGSSGSGSTSSRPRRSPPRRPRPRARVPDADRRQPHRRLRTAPLSPVGGRRRPRRLAELRRGRPHGRHKGAVRQGCAVPAEAGRSRAPRDGQRRRGRRSA